jgi:hypothetical protein
MGRVIDPFSVPRQPGLKRRLIFAQVMQQASGVTKLAIAERRRKPSSAFSDVCQMIDQGLPSGLVFALHAVCEESVNHRPCPSPFEVH